MHNPINANQFLSISILLCILSLTKPSFAMEDNGSYPLNIVIQEFLAGNKGMAEVLSVINSGHKLNPNEHESKIILLNLVYTLNVGVRRPAIEYLIKELKPDETLITYMINNLVNIRGVTSETRKFLEDLLENAAIDESITLIHETTPLPLVAQDDAVASSSPSLHFVKKKKKRRCVLQ